MNFVEHHFVTGGKLPPYSASLYDYLVAGNGVFLRSRREGLEVILPVTSCEIRGLAPVEPFVRLAYPRVPAPLVQEMLEYALCAQDAEESPVEMLFHLEWRQDHWQLNIPDQEQTVTSVIPTDDGPGSSYATALIDLHSHHQMGAFFSRTDDQDERKGFRIYAVLGCIFTRPELLVRAGCEGAFLVIPATQIFELPEGVVDAATAWEDGDQVAEADRVPAGEQEGD